MMAGTILAIGISLMSAADAAPNRATKSERKAAKAAAQSTAALTLVGTYQLASITGREVRDPDLAKTRITFMPSGDVGIATACNQMGSRLQVRAAPGRILSFGQTLQTTMACEGGAGRAETQISQVIRDTANIARAGNRLTFFNTNGATLAQWTVETPTQTSPEVSAPQPGAAAPQRFQATMGDYVLVELNGRPVRSPPARPVPAPSGAPSIGMTTPEAVAPDARIVPSQPSMMLIEDGSVTGSGGCNRYTTRLVSGGRNIKRFEPVVSSKRACLDQGASRLENDYFNALRGAVRVDIREGRIDLYNRSGRRIARLASISARASAGPSLYGRNWVLRQFNQVPIRQTNPPTIKFDGDNASGTTGCNQFSFTHTRQNGRSRFTNGIATEMACAEPARMTLEARYMQAMSTITSMSISSTTLTLRSTDGRTVLVFAAD
jgi:heat shock protein HslJ